MTLKERLPRWEAEYILPLWLLLTIAAAAVAETIIIGYGIQVIYGLWIGWPVGFTVASAQALGSQMFAYNATHNAMRYIRWRTRKVRGEPVRYESQHESEPRFNTWQPLAVSVLAGVLAAAVALALYGRMNGGLTFLNWAVSLASPAASISAALLNGLFAAGELALRRFREPEAERNEPEPAPQAEPAAPAQEVASTIGEPVRDRAFAELDRNPELSGAALAAQVGVTAGYGRKLKRDWTALHGNGSGRVPEREEQEV